MDLVDENAINIYTDGSSHNHPRRGGIGIRFVWVGDDGYEITEDVEPAGFKDATNQEMELQACIVALTLLRRGRTDVPIERFSKILIHTDSQYVVNNYSAAVNFWQSNGWRTRDGAPVVNADLWKQLIRRVHAVGIRVRWTWVKGHKDSVHNKAADKLAKTSAKVAVRAPLHVGTVRRKVSDKQVQPGSVELIGQRLTIHIVTDRFLPRQRCWQYRYEVMSKRSPFFKCVDFVCSDQVLRAGHTYRVRFNDDPKNPWLAKGVFGIQ